MYYELDFSQEVMIRLTDEGVQRIKDGTSVQLRFFHKKATDIIEDRYVKATLEQLFTMCAEEMAFRDKYPYGNSHA